MKNLYNKFLKKIEKETRESEIQSQIEMIFQKKEKEYNVKVNVVNAFILKEAFGFGEKRIRRYLEECSRIQKQMYERYDDADLYAMESKLKDIGIDVRDIIEKEYDNPNRGFTIIET